MTKIKEKYDRYKISDWITLVIGVIICALQVLKYYHDGLGEYSVEIVVAVIWLLLLIAPKSINDIIRKLRGLETNSLENDNKK